MMRQIPEPSSDGSPYIPVITYTTDWPTVIIIPNTKKTTKLSDINQFWTSIIHCKKCFYNKSCWDITKYFDPWTFLNKNPHLKGAILFTNNLESFKEQLKFTKVLTFLSTVKQSTILYRVANLNNFCSCQKLWKHSKHIKLTDSSHLTAGRCNADYHQTQRNIYLPA